MKKRKAKRRLNKEKEHSVFTEEEQQFINLIARIIVDITLEQAKNQNIGRSLKP